MSAAAIEPGGTPRNDGPAPLVAWIDRSWGSGPGTHGGYLAALGLAAMRARRRELSTATTLVAISPR